MKTIKTVQETIKEHKRIANSFCDICKQEIQYRSSEGSQVVTIESFYGFNYPESDCRNFNGIDCCMDCYDHKVRPLIEKTFGIKFLEWNGEDSEVEKYESQGV